jgi:DNA polymerase-3 subunit gamma/tau
VFVLLTTEPAKIPDTVVSRSQQFVFRRLTPADIVGRLRYIADEQKLQLTDELLVEIALRSEGGMRDAVMTLDQLSYVEITDVEDYREMFGYRDLAVPLMGAALDGDVPRGFELIEDYFSRVGDPAMLIVGLVGLVRDLMVILSGGEPPGASEEALVARRALADRVAADRLVAAVRVLWELKPRARPTEPDQRAQVEMGWVLLCEALGPREAPEPIQHRGDPTREEQRLTIEQMAAMAESSA